MAEKFDSDQTFCSIVEPSQEAVRVVVRSRCRRYKWKKFHTAVLRSRKKVQKSPSECSDVQVTNAELRYSQMEARNHIASIKLNECSPPPLLSQQPSPDIATQYSNKVKRSGHEESRHFAEQRSNQPSLLERQPSPDIVPTTQWSNKIKLSGKKSGHSDSKVTISELRPIQPHLLERQQSLDNALATQSSNKPKPLRKRENRGRPRKKIDCGVQTSPVRSTSLEIGERQFERLSKMDCGVQTSPVRSTSLEIGERQVERLSKKLKLPVGETKVLIEQAMADEDGNETSGTESVVSNSQKSFRMPRKRWRRPIKQQIPLHTPILQEPKPRFVRPPETRPYFTPVPSTPVRVAANQRKPEFTISPKTYKELTQSPTNRISRMKLNCSSVRLSPKFTKQRQPSRQEWYRAFAAPTTKYRRNLLFDDHEVQSSHCTSTVFDDDDDIVCGNSDSFFLEDTLQLFCI